MRPATFARFAEPHAVNGTDSPWDWKQWDGLKEAPAEGPLASSQAIWPMQAHGQIDVVG